MTNLARPILLAMATALIMPLASWAQGVIDYTIINPPCQGNDGVIQVNIISGLNPPYDVYYYNSGATVVHNGVTTNTDQASGLPDCDYIYVVGNQGSSYGYIPVVMNPGFVVDYPTIVSPICPATQGTIEFTINQGQAPTAVSWYDYVEPIVGAFITNNNPATLTVGSDYLARIEDGSGCYAERTIGSAQGDSIIFEAISNMVVTTTTTPANCTNGTATVGGVSGGVAPYTYEWNNGATSATITGLQMGQYQVTVTDAQGCTGYTWAYVNQAVQIIGQTDVTNATCLQNDGAITGFGSGGVPPYTYLWDNGATTQTVTGLTGGTQMMFTVTDANGCYGQGWAYVQSTTPITATVAVTASQCTAPTGTAALTINGGTAPYTVLWNTFPQQTGPNATGLAVGTYGFEITDAVGCVRTGSAVIPPATVLNATIGSADAICPATTGSVGVSVNGSNPPFTYLWNNGATTAQLSGVPVGSYSCTITDAVGCNIVKSDNIQTYSPVNVGVSTTPASCMYTCDGQAYANATGGTAPYTYTWGGGQSGQNATGLCPGYNGVSVVDANGCADSQGFQLGYNTQATDCYCTISGRVFEDLDGDCTYDVGEPPMQNIQIHCAGFGYDYTDAQGMYSFHVPVGNYTVSQTVQAFYPLAACQTNSFPVNITATSTGCGQVIDFANVINPIHDIHVVTTWTGMPPVPGNPYTVKMIISNNGTVTEPGVIVGYEDDGQLNAPTFANLSTVQNNPGGQPNWYSSTSFPTLAPGQSQVVFAHYQVPTDIPMSTQLVFEDTATYQAPMATWLSDYSPWNNTNDYGATVVSSYDPNMVEVLPQGEGQPGYILTTDSVLDYVVHFQNTGTYYAQNVVIRLTLDTDVQINSLIPGYSDHSYEIQINEDREVTITFANIHLPWQAQSELGSQGMVTFSVKQAPGLAVGTLITCQAAIYFDYNEPVITNTALNTITDQIGVAEPAATPTLSLYPNPNNGQFTLTLSADAGTLQQVTVFDLMGRPVFRTTTNTQRLDLGDMPAGHYVVVVNTDRGVFNRKFVVVGR